MNEKEIKELIEFIIERAKILPYETTSAVIDDRNAHFIDYKSRADKDDYNKDTLLHAIAMAIGDTIINDRIYKKATFED